MTQPMTQQTPFESEGPLTSPHRGGVWTPEPHTRMTRHEKMEFLDETTHFNTNNALLKELVSWLTDDDFNQFYEEFCSNWDICRSPEELEQRYGDEQHGQ